MEIKSIASLLQSQPKHNSACVRIRDRPLLGLALWQEKWEPTTSWTYSSALGSLMMPDGGGLPCSQIYRGLEKQFPSTWLCLMSQVSKWNQIALKKKKCNPERNRTQGRWPILGSWRDLLDKGRRKLMPRKTGRDEWVWQRSSGDMNMNPGPPRLLLTISQTSELAAC